MQEQALSILAIAGLMVSVYLLFSQRTGRKPLCIIGKSCDLVIRSRYASTFGIPNTVLGIAYYALLLVPPSAYAQYAPAIPLVILAVSAVASVFSAYLVYIQAFVLKEWCDYCIASAVINWAASAVLLTNHL
ncbi:MAG: vitamin K epoxide reductase family protein [Candidatus Micrarchaeia archaeon]